MTRHQDWQLRFANFVRDRASVPFAWGRNDCALFAADCVQALTGVDPAADLRGYTSAGQAARLIEACGGLRQIVSNALGAELTPLMAGVGDVVLVLNEGREALAICNGSTAIAPAAWGSAVLDMSVAKAAWRV